MNDELIDLLTRLWEYMDEKADYSELTYEDGTPRPNKEAILMAEIDEALEKLK